MTYSLEKDGDEYEIHYWNLLKRDFPNYEVFWARFIVPLTGRDDGRGIGLREGIDPLLESIAMAHYTVFYHLGVAIELRARFDQDFSEDILFHLSSATEMVERLIFILAKFQDTELPAKFTNETVIKMSSEYFSSKNYSKDFERFMKRGQAVSARLHNIEDVIKPFMQNISDDAARDFEKWQDIRNQIRHYRNTLAHNPRLGMLLADGKKIYVPKEHMLHKYELWSDLAKRPGNDDFVLLTDLLANFQQNITKRTNDLWACLIAFMDEVSKAGAYTQLKGSASQIIVLDHSQPGDPIFPPPSGTHPYDPTQSSID